MGKACKVLPSSSKRRNLGSARSAKGLMAADNFDFEADPGAVVIWFSDDLALNEQTRFRGLLEATDRLNVSSLEVLQNTLNREKVDA